MDKAIPLISQFRLGKLTLPNRIVMAPMVRGRAQVDSGIPGDLLTTYYAQRADAGLIVTEALAVSAQGKNYHRASGLYTTEQIEGWAKVCEAVHARGGRIVAQLLHAGRASHTLNQPLGTDPVGPSAIPMTTKTLTKNGFLPASMPRALRADEIPSIVESFAEAARRAADAGFDGVEIHGANGYLLDQFLKSGSNIRADAYGGSIENRIRLTIEVVDAVLTANPNAGIRLAPGPAQDAADADPQALFSTLIETLATKPLNYVHMVEGTASGGKVLDGVDYTKLRALFPGPWIANNGYGRETANAAIADGRVDLVAFGRLYIANPDLVRRFARDAPLNPPDKTTFFEGEQRGLIDYPTLSEVT